MSNEILTLAWTKFLLYQKIYRLIAKPDFRVYMDEADEETLRKIEFYVNDGDYNSLKSICKKTVVMLEEKTVPELRKLAQNYYIHNYQNLDKASLLSEIRKELL